MKSRGDRCRKAPCGWAALRWLKQATSGRMTVEAPRQAKARMSSRAIVRTEAMAMPLFDRLESGKVISGNPITGAKSRVSRDVRAVICLEPLGRRYVTG